MKKGQLFGQPIMYVFYAIVAVLVLVFGIKIAMDLKDNSDLITEEIFFKDVEDKFDSVYRDAFGSSISLRDLQVPSDMAEFCFADFSKDKDLNEVVSARLKDFIDISYEGDDVENVYVVNRNKETSSTRIERDFILDEFVLCDVLTDGELDIILINEGQFIRAQHI